MLYHGDLRDVLPTLPAESVEACVCDPPYDLTAQKPGGSGVASVDLDSPYGRSRIGTGNGSGGFMGKAWDATGVAFDPETWRHVWRVLKPGGHLIAFGGTRTFHRLTCAIEDAGFEIRDCLMWLYGSGFPKSLDVSKALDKLAGVEREVTPTEAMQAKGDVGEISSNVRCAVCGKARVSADPCRCPRDNGAQTKAAKQWEGWGTALKPGWEPIILARKPLIGSVALNVLTHGTGALNIDATRIGWPDGVPQIGTPGWGGPNKKLTVVPMQGGDTVERDGANVSGRWPANVLLDAEAAQLLDAQSGPLSSGGGEISGATAFGQGTGWNAHQNRTTAIDRITDEGWRVPVFLLRETLTRGARAWLRVAACAAA